MFSYLKNTFFGTNKLTPWILDYIVGRPVESRSRLVQVVRRGGGWWRHSSSSSSSSADHDDDTAYIELHDGTHSVRAYLSRSCKQQLRRDHGGYFLQFTERGSIITIGHQLSKVKCPYTKVALQIEVLTPKKVETAITAKFKPVWETIEVRQILQAQEQPWRSSANVPLGTAEQLLQSPEALDRFMGRRNKNDPNNAPFGNPHDLLNDPASREIAWQLVRGEGPTTSTTSTTAREQRNNAPVATKDDVQDLLNNPDLQDAILELTRDKEMSSSPPSSPTSSLKQTAKQANKPKLRTSSGWSDSEEDENNKGGPFSPSMGIQEVLRSQSSPEPSPSQPSPPFKSRATTPTPRKKTPSSSSHKNGTQSSRGKKIIKATTSSRKVKETKLKRPLSIRFVKISSKNGEELFEARYTSHVPARRKNNIMGRWSSLWKK